MNKPIYAEDEDRNILKFKDWKHLALYCAKYVPLKVIK